MTEPLPPLIAVDIARQSTLTQILSSLQDLSRKVDILMTEDATVSAEVTQIAADEAATLTAIRSLQALVAALQAEVAAGNLSQATLDALAQAQAASDALRTEAEADVAADSPPAPSA